MIRMPHHPALLALMLTACAPEPSLRPEQAGQSEAKPEEEKDDK